MLLQYTHLHSFTDIYTMAQTSIKTCMATSKSKPNHSGNARGRKAHATIDGKLTICNMLVEKSRYAYKDVECRDKCKVCFK